MRGLGDPVPSSRSLSHPSLSLGSSWRPRGHNIITYGGGLARRTVRTYGDPWSKVT